MTDTATIHEDEILAIIEEIILGTAAYCEQTGGGCATIFVGDQRVPATADEDDEDEARYLLAIGPGYFASAGWQDGTFDLGDLYVGPDDASGEFDAWTVSTVDELRAAVEYWATHAPDWRTLAERPAGDGSCEVCGLYTRGIAWQGDLRAWVRAACRYASNPHCSNASEAGDVCGECVGCRSAFAHIHDAVTR